MKVDPEMCSAEFLDSRFRTPTVRFNHAEVVRFAFRDRHKPDVAPAELRKAFCKSEFGRRFVHDSPTKT
jgi:hypothetical protein